ncbi:MAG TPA: hypothetical protein VJL34_06060 [Anaerolineales bacterium]|nr:hypothetical protein [Anaerolineales bacterium]
MDPSKTTSRAAKLVRWVARLLSLLVLGFALLIFLEPEPNAVEPLPLKDWIELGFYGLALLGLLLAWRWEGLGGAIAILGVLGNNVAFLILRGYWMGGLLIPAFFVSLPGILFLVYWAMTRNMAE